MRLATFVFFACTLAMGQGSCTRCAIGGNCKSSPSGGCQCDSGGVTCATCGFCNSILGCTQPCNFLTSSNLGIKDAAWFNNTKLTAQLASASPLMSQLYSDLQEKMIRTGKAYLTEGSTGPADHRVMWKAYHASGSHYAVLEADGERLVMDTNQWTLYRDTPHLFNLWTSHRKLAGGGYN